MNIENAKERFEHWVNSKGAYIMEKKHIDSLRDALFHPTKHNIVFIPHNIRKLK